MLTQSKRSVPQLVGAIFAGGESRRMGEPKEGLHLWDGRPMLAHVIDALAPLCEKIAVVGHCRGFNLEVDSRLLHVLDRQPGLGPVSALEALLSSGLGAHYLVASCDQPLLETPLLQKLVDEIQTESESTIFFKSTDGEELDPFPGIYPALLLPLAQQALDEQEYALRKLLRKAPIHWVEIPMEKKDALSNCNTPEAIAAITSLKQVQEVVQ